MHGEYPFLRETNSAKPLGDNGISAAVNVTKFATSPITS